MTPLIPDDGLTLDEIELRWNELAETPKYRDVAYKIETDRYGQVISDPVKGWHRRVQTILSRLLEDALPDGVATIELAVHTSDGTKVPDVVWCSQETWEQHRDARGARQAPEICVEVLSKTNTAAEMKHKRRLYFEEGAAEVWICDRDGTLTVFADGTRSDASLLAPDFPTSISLP